MTDVVKHAAETRIKVIQATNDDKRSALSQHLTPPETAKLAASMFSDLEADQQFIRCLDLGAGTGMLSVALYDRYDGHIGQIDAVEMDEALATIYEAEMASVGVPHDLILGDALVDAPDRLYDRVILNPPYKKMAAGDVRQRNLPCRSANLYSAFIAVGLSRLAEGGELVAIVPRSWMNGDYFTSFRRYALSFFSLDAIHIYESRTEVFSDTKVLQETMLVRFSNRRQSKCVKVTQSIGKSDVITMSEHAADALIDPLTYVVRIAPEGADGPGETISSSGLCPSTGKVVDFRSKERIYNDKPDSDAIYPLLYAGNFSSGEMTHPRDFGKPQWYRADDEKSMQQLMQPGSYVVVKRFTSKEEKRRVAAFPLTLETPITLENHLNFIHEGTSRKVVPLRSAELSRGLALWLNTTFVDEWFRNVSGSTQVNAGDIRAMPCPPLDQLEDIGMCWKPGMTQAEVDEVCESVR